MRRRMQRAQNLDKAIEVRLEGEIGIYYVILAGMTINLHITRKHAPQPGNQNTYVQIENDTFKVFACATYNEAKRKYKKCVDKYEMSEVREG